MAGFYTQKGDDKGGTGLPEGHWMHGAMAKEKARLAKKKKGAPADMSVQGDKLSSSQTPPEVPPKTGKAEC